MKCSQCGRDSSGRFCSSCGAPLKARGCPSCGADLAPGARFCTQCGNATGGTGGKAAGAGGAGGTDVRWWIAAGIMAVVLIVILLLPVLRSDSGGQTPAAATGGNGMVDLANMSPRQAADQLFNRVMTSASAGNTAEVEQFLPMAIQSYDMARPLDQDGFFHLALLQGQAADWAAAITAAEEGLATYPDHLLNLSVAADAAASAGDEAQARQFYQRFLDAYDVESIKQLPEYQAHGTMFPEMKSAAEAYISG